MNIFSVIPLDLFSILASPNKVIYSDALFVLYDAFQENLKIPRETLFTMIRNRLENALVYTSFEDEGIDEEEACDLSGKSRFLIRKLKEKGWIDIERDNNFLEYIIIPEYSIRIIELLKSITDGERTSGFSFVFDAYSSLKLANEDENAGAFEKMMALSGARDKTEAMTKSLKLVYHNINRYVQKLIETDNINEILYAHYDDFYHKIIKEYIQPLKIKDSIPKYKNPIGKILDEWLESENTIDDMAKAAASEHQNMSYEESRHSVISSIFYIKESYETIENEYLSEIDEKVRKYIRATTKKIAYLTNTDRTAQGNLVFLLNAIAGSKDDDMTRNIGTAFQLYRQEFLSENSLYHSKTAQRRGKQNPVLIDESDVGIGDKIKEEYWDTINSPFSEYKVFEFMKHIFGDSPVAFSDDMDVPDDHAYILSLLAVLHGNDKGVFYKPEFLGGNINCGKYSVPKIRFEREDGK